MDGFQKRKRRYKFTEKKHSTRGIVAFVLALLLIIFFIAVISMAFHSEGNLSLYFGSFGVLSVVGSLVSLGIAISSLSDENAFRLFPRLGLIFSIISILLWGGVYVQGFLA